MLFIQFNILKAFSSLVCDLCLWAFQFLEVIKLESLGQCSEDAMMSRDMFLLQVSIIFLSFSDMLHVNCGDHK